MPDRDNVLAGFPTVYTADQGEALPEVDDLDTGTTTITVGGNWTQLPFTMDEYTLELNIEMESVKVNEHDFTIKWAKVGEEAFFACKFKEFDMAALHAALAASTLTTVAAAGDQTGQDTLGIGDGSLTEKALLLVGTNPEGGSRVIECPLVMPVTNLSLPFRKQSIDYDVRFEIGGLPSRSSGERMIKIYDITAEATT